MKTNKLNLRVLMILCGIFLIPQTLIQAQTCTPAPVGLVSWYEGETNALDSRSRHNGTIQGNVNYLAGQIGQSFTFNPNDASKDAVIIPSTGIFKGQSQATIEAFVRPRGASSNEFSFGGQIFGENTSAADYTRFGLFVFNDGKVVALGRTNETGGAARVDSTAMIPLNQWSHIAATWDAAQGVRIYINGALSGSLNQAVGTFSNTDSSLTAIGAGGVSSGNLSYAFDGDIDEVSVYTRALSASEIASIATAGTAGKCKPAAIVAPSGQALWLAGDGSAQDISGNGNNGTLQDTAGFAVGRVGQAFNFDGGRVVIPNVSNLNVQTGDFAIEAWVNLRAYANDGAFIAGKETCNGINRYALFVGGTGLPFITVRNSDGATFNAVSSSPIALGGWHHLVGVREGNTLKIFVNGQQTGTVALSGSFAAQNLPFQIGNRDCILNSTVGLIDEVSVYSRALTTTEIQSIYNAGVAGKLKQTTTTGTTATIGDVTVTYSSAATRTTQVIPLETADFPAPTMGTHTGLIYDIASSASPTGTATVCFNLQAFNDAATFSRLRVLHFESTGWENRTSSLDFSSRTLCAQVTSLSPFAIVLLPPTAAHVSVGGRVTMPNGKGVARARVSLIDPSGNTRFALTDFSGSYRFEAVEVGQTYVLSVSRKGYQFDQPTQVLFVNEDLNGVNFVALF